MYKEKERESRKKKLLTNNTQKGGRNLSSCAIDCIVQ